MAGARFDITTLGEIMLRLSVPPGTRLEIADQFDVHPGGAESNVVTLLARLGRRAAWCGALPDSPLGRLAANHMRMAGVNLDGVIWSPDGRMGTYYVEFATPPRAIQVVYDRADSCAARLTPEQVDWSQVLDTRVLHLTGITPALSTSCSRVITEAIERAKAAGITVSFDVNYRARLWDAGVAAGTLLPLMYELDLLFCSLNDAARLFHCQGDPEQMIGDLAQRTAARAVVMSVGEGGVIGWDGTSLTIWPLHKAPPRSTIKSSVLPAPPSPPAKDGSLPLSLRRMSCYRLC
ncbi:MAG: sugar kinase [Caldilineaceae bacterium]|nr:sugar kinase [Caldilineaceae bacterium]